ncbi:(2Fe-2S)-binding protein [Methylovulum psychrotolerans]|uniref:Bacterioferritin-associated ferredoxin n=1 Tax=Methylovulum psychrotolerans TaxID=1704499 RepID=A0A2S5CPZ1_9GAMM|nr:(2Fe-2S)-binding protein [Methylovulum psychrotolerans]POZ52881.1 (2Fe-2S)-binding protein [Methylovulum psychrotolerans]
MYVCVCKAVTDKQIKTAIDNGVCTRRQLFECFGVGSDCGKCNKHVKELLNQNSTGYSIMPSAVNQPLLNAA